MQLVVWQIFNTQRPNLCSLTFSPWTDMKHHFGIWSKIFVAALFSPEIDRKKAYASTSTRIWKLFCRGDYSFTDIKCVLLHHPQGCGSCTLVPLSPKLCTLTDVKHILHNPQGCGSHTLVLIRVQTYIVCPWMVHILIPYAYKKCGVFKLLYSVFHFFRIYCILAPSCLAKKSLLFTISCCYFL